jgi:hypothetical protein
VKTSPGSERRRLAMCKKTPPDGDDGDVLPMTGRARRANKPDG